VQRLRSRRFRKSRRGAPHIPTALGVVLALGLVATGGWVAAGRLAPEKISYTKGPAIQIAARAAAPPAPQPLQAKLQDLADGYHDPMGIAVTDVTDGWTAQVAGDQTFPQQSVSKLWVAIAVMQAVDEGRLSLDRQVVMGPDDRSVFYQPLASRIRGAGLTITIADLLRHALIESDNAANDKLIAELGGAQAVTATIAAKGLHGVAVGGTERDVQTRTAGLTWKPEYGRTWIFKTARAQLPDAVRDQAQAAYLANPPDGATPDGIATGLAALERGELLSRASTDFMLGLMSEARTGAMRMHAAVPSGWNLAHKTGTGPDWRGASVGINDVGLLTAPDGRTYAVAVMIRQTSRPPSARYAIMQNVVRAVVAEWAAHDRPPAEGRQIASVPPAAVQGF
jgi:beta-lactamase class A